MYYRGKKYPPPLVAVEEAQLPQPPQPLSPLPEAQPQPPILPSPLQEEIFIPFGQVNMINDFRRL